MSFTQGSSVGTAQSKAASTTLVITTGVNLTVGQLAVLLIANDNIRTTDNDGTGTSGLDVTGVVDSGGSNTWSVASEICNSNGAANAGATLTLVYCIITTQLNSGGTITITFNGSPTAKAATCRSFNSSIGNGVSLNGGINAGQARGDGVDPAQINYDSLETQEKLWIHGIAYEGDHGDSYTHDSDLTTNFTSDGTTGGGAASNMSVRGGTVINTTQDLVINVATGAARDHAQALWFFRENAAATGGSISLLLGVG